MMELTYKRLLLKLSGEQLAGEHAGGIDPQLVTWIAGELKQATDLGAEVALMVGGGNYVRGAQIAGSGITRVTGDYMGMLATMLNGLAINDIFNAAGLPSRVLSSIMAEQVADFYTQRRALNHLQKGRVVVLAGGTARPYLTTDTAAVNLALELDCDIVCKITKVDGVYSKDPAKHPDAQKIARMSFQQAVEDSAIKVMDKAALGLAMECGKPIMVFDLLSKGNIRRAVTGEAVGTLIS